MAVWRCSLSPPLVGSRSPQSGMRDICHPTWSHSPRRSSDVVVTNMIRNVCFQASFSRFLLIQFRLLKINYEVEWYFTCDIDQIDQCMFVLMITLLCCWCFQNAATMRGIPGPKFPVVLLGEAADTVQQQQLTRTVWGRHTHGKTIVRYSRLIAVLLSPRRLLAVAWAAAKGRLGSGLSIINTVYQILPWGAAVIHLARAGWNFNLKHIWSFRMDE